MRNFLQMISLTFAFSQLKVITLMAHSKRGPCGSSIPYRRDKRNIITWMFLVIAMMIRSIPKARVLRAF